jgi:hypothetical protein
MSSNSSKNGKTDEVPKGLSAIQKLHWKSTYDLLRKHTNATEQEARAGASKKVAVLEEIERELATA